MKTSVALLAVMAVAALATTALAKDYTVGGSYGWDTYVDYDKWAAGKTFMVGDTLDAYINVTAFKYEPYHNVLEVREANYDSCTVVNPISTHSGGATTFELTTTGTRYFICGIPHHCLNGTMHVQVTTVPYSAAAAVAAAAGPSPAPLPADSYADKKAPSPSADKVLMDVAARSPAAAPSTAASAPRFHQPAVAVAGLAAVAALVALAA